jgi:hypothetical protein
LKYLKSIVISIGIKFMSFSKFIWSKLNNVLTKKHSMAFLLRSLKCFVKW